MDSQESSECNPGDLIEMFRDGFQHWALYMGDGYLVHLAVLRDSPEASASREDLFLSKKAVVKKVPLADVKRSTYRVNNQLDKELQPLPVEQIISTAERMIGEKMEFDISSNNCEHFVTKLRYGVPRCLQIEKGTVAPELAEALADAAAAAAPLAQSAMTNSSHPSDSLKKPQDPALEAADQPTPPPPLPP
ncbi:phospholipase A and acyltransferase 4-like [Phyllostomus hastatus]|uniref:phospholipase A and acyltransferase 4-like n=1 Tax=Phyllostomus hastatus TaxID=9423 RepID=UPI001E67E5CF|nr:phospholipase A and acyltransferase 4-like [Phyllostomus hastatus]